MKSGSSFDTIFFINILVKNAIEAASIRVNTSPKRSENAPFWILRKYAPERIVSVMTSFLRVIGSLKKKAENKIVNNTTVRIRNAKFVAVVFASAKFSIRPMAIALPKPITAKITILRAFNFLASLFFLNNIMIQKGSSRAVDQRIRVYGFSPIVIWYLKTTIWHAQRNAALKLKKKAGLRYFLIIGESIREGFFNVKVGGQTRFLRPKSIITFLKRL